MNFFALNIQILRKAAELNQGDFEELIDVKRTTWNNWENDKSEPDIDEILRISDLFKVSVDDLLRKDFSNDVEVMHKIESIKKTTKSIGKSIGNGIGKDQNITKVEEPKGEYSMKSKDEIIADQRHIIDTQKALINSLNQHLSRLEGK